MTIGEMLESVKIDKEIYPLQNAKGMTVKEIADLCGVKRRTVELWIGKDDFLSENISLRKSIRDKLEQGSPENPSDYTLEETLAIIGDGGGNKTLASLLADNADSKAVIRRAVKLVKGGTWRYIEHSRPVDRAVQDVYALKEKYRYSEKVSKQDALKLFRCANILHDYYYDGIHLFDLLVLDNTIWEEKIAVVMKKLEEVAKLQVEGGAVPTIQSKEWLIGMWDYFHTGKKLKEAIKDFDELEDKTGLAEAALKVLENKIGAPGAAPSGNALKFESKVANRLALT